MLRYPGDTGSNVGDPDGVPVGEPASNALLCLRDPAPKLNRRLLSVSGSYPRNPSRLALRLRLGRRKLPLHSYV